MRYPDGGGLTVAGRARREDVRLQAAGMFEQDVSAAQVAHELRVSTKPAYQWRRRWRAGGEAALVSKGPGGMVCRLSGAQLARLRAALEGGPAAWGGMRISGGRCHPLGHVDPPPPSPRTMVPQTRQARPRRGSFPGQLAKCGCLTRESARAPSKSPEPTSAMAVNESGLGSSADGKGEEGIDRSFDRAAAPVHLGE